MSYTNNHFRFKLFVNNIDTGYTCSLITYNNRVTKVIRCYLDSPGDPIILRQINFLQERNSNAPISGICTNQFGPSYIEFTSDSNLTITTSNLNNNLNNLIGLNDVIDNNDILIEYDKIVKILWCNGLDYLTVNGGHTTIDNGNNNTNNKWYYWVDKTKTDTVAFTLRNCSNNNFLFFTGGNKTALHLVSDYDNTNNGFLYSLGSKESWDYYALQCYLDSGQNVDGSSSTVNLPLKTRGWREGDQRGLTWLIIDQTTQEIIINNIEKDIKTKNKKIKK